MKIQSRLLFLTISMTSIAVIAALLVSTYLIRNALETRAQNLLSSLLDARHSALTGYLDQTQRQINLLSTSTTAAESLTALRDAYIKLGSNAQTWLQQNYLAKNTLHKAQSTPSPESDYERTHDVTQQFLLRYIETFTWNDILFIDLQGNVVFSTAKAKDFGTNLISGPWKDTGLARAVRPLLHEAVPGVMSFSDFEHYSPAENRPAAFLAMPVFDKAKQVFLGVVAIQLPIKQINELMGDTIGLGESGEIFVIGRDGWMLSDMRLEKENTVLQKQIKTVAATKVLKGESGHGQVLDYRGIDVYVAFKPLRPFQAAGFLGDHDQWGVIAKIDQSEVLADFYTVGRMLLLTGAVLVLLALAVGLQGARTITRPLFSIRDALTKLSRGEAAEVPGLERSDEIGEMAKAAETFREMTQQVEHDHWIAENVNALTGAVSAENRVDKAADNVLHLLCERLVVPVGGIYLLNDNAYQRVGAHGLARRSQTEDTFQLGEGLLGQCAKDNQALVLSPVPAGLAIISTGLAEFPPHELVLYPIAHKDEVLAVLELAATNSLTPIQHEFLKAASAALGLHLANLHAAEHNLLLLDETRKQSVELKAQQEVLLRSNEEMRAMAEELRSQAEEMKAQNEELKANQEELRAQQDEMQHKNQLLEMQSEQLKEVIQEAETKAKELQLANQYKSEFLANMSHELRTPLNSVLILSRSLAENEASNLTPEQVESATVISESGTQLLTLINDILDLSKIEAGKLELVKEPFPLDDLLAYLRRIFSPLAEKKQLEFNIQVATDVPETIFTDRQRLTQVLTNLLSNAIKFTDSGEVGVSVAKEANDLLLEVTDSGVGIPSDKLEHIFGAFQQLDGSTSRKYGGSGLGLAISRHLARLLGGEIEVKTQAGAGSCFTLRLLNQFAIPVNSEVPQRPLAVQESRKSDSIRAVAESSGGSILVIEDDSRLLNILGRMIKALGFTPLCVESAEQALEAIAKDLPMGILLDLGLPHMNGMELLRRLKEGKATGQIPVYIMSGGIDSGEAKVLGALGFLKKPVTRETIAAAIKGMGTAGIRASFKRILLIDNNPSDINAVKNLFKQDAIEINLASNARDATRMLKTSHFDTVIIDLQLPDITGLEWLKQSGELLNPPPVVIYSAVELSEQEVFELKEFTESIVKKGPSTDRLREEVLLAVQINSAVGKTLAPAAVPVSGKRLLLVDDDARNLYALTKVLRAKGFSIEVAADSANALEKLNQASFDAVLTDIMMPEMDGYALIRQIRALGYSNMPIVAITAKAMQGDEALCLQAGATAYMAKPVDMNRLLELLKEV